MRKDLWEGYLPTISNRWGRIALYLGRNYPFEHIKKTNLTLKWMIYGSVKSIGIDPTRMEDIPSKYLTSGRGWQSSSIVVHLGENILTYL